MTEIDKSYTPEGVEEKWYDYWIASKLFVADPGSDAPPFSVVIPPPNVTGTLHMGHALNTTLQDVLVRWRRMSGDNVLWVPGMDHAGIATQNVVERQLTQEKRTGIRLAGMLLSDLSGNGRLNMAGRSFISLRGLGPPATGRGNGLLWMKDFLAQSSRCLSVSTKRD